MKKISPFLLLAILLAGCLSNPSKSPGLSASPLSTLTPASPATTAVPNPTGLFITQVMGQKYAAQTQSALIPTETPTPGIPSDSPACHAADLTAGTSFQGATGNLAISIGVINTSAVPCFLPAWPAVQLLTPSGTPLDVEYQYITMNGNPSSLPPTAGANHSETLEYGLAVGRTASMILSWSDWCQGAVNPGVTIQLELLGIGNRIDIPTDIGGGGRCDDPGGPSIIQVMGFGY